MWLGARQSFSEFDEVEASSELPSVILDEIGPIAIYFLRHRATLRGHIVSYRDVCEDV